MTAMITHSLLSSWLYSIKEDPFSDATTEDTSRDDFLRVLRREPTPTSEAMQNGIDFENLVTEIVNGGHSEMVMEVLQEPNSGEIIESKKYPKWFGAAVQVARMIQGGKLQVVARETVQISRMEILLYGRLDVLKAGHIYDIKFSKGYERGKYISSTQHPMYMELVPGAEDFTYLVSNGTDVWTETYRRDETPAIGPIIRDFLGWLEENGLMQIYLTHWGTK